MGKKKDPDKHRADVAARSNTAQVNARAAEAPFRLDLRRIPGDPFTDPTTGQEYTPTPEQADEELWWTVYTLTGFKIPRHAVCTHRNHVAPFTAFADAFFRRYPLTIWKGARGLGGKSRTLAVLSVIELMLFGIEVRLLGGSGAQSKNVLDASREAWDHHNAPKYLLGDSGALTTATRLSNGGLMETLTASETSVRGPHPPSLRMDEIDAMKYSILDSARGMPQEKTNKRGRRIRPQTVMSSTHQNVNGTMTKMLEEAKKRDEEIARGKDRRPIPVYEWCYRESMQRPDLCAADPYPHPVCGWLTEEGVEDKRDTMSQVAWDTEVEMQEPSIEGRAIDQVAIEVAFDVHFGEEVFEPVPDPETGELLDPREPQEYEETDLTFEAKVEHRRYVTGIDWASARDHTVVATFDATDDRRWRCVRWQAYQKMSWPATVRRALAQWREYDGDLVHDNTGVGRAAHDILMEETSDREQERIRPHNISASNRRPVNSAYVAALEKGRIVYPRIRFAYDEHRFATEEDLYGKGHTPDSVIAGALAWTLAIDPTGTPDFAMTDVGGKGASGWDFALGPVGATPGWL